MEMSKRARKEPEDVNDVTRIECITNKQLGKFGSCRAYVVNIQNASSFWGERAKDTNRKFQKWNEMEENQKLKFLSIFLLDTKNNFRYHMHVRNNDPKCLVLAIVFISITTNPDFGTHPLLTHS